MLNGMIDDIIIFTALTFQVGVSSLSFSKLIPLFLLFFSGLSNLDSDPTVGSGLRDLTLWEAGVMNF